MHFCWFSVHTHTRICSRISAGILFISSTDLLRHFWDNSFIPSTRICCFNSAGISFTSTTGFAEASLTHVVHISNPELHLHFYWYSDHIHNPELVSTVLRSCPIQLCTQFHVTSSSWLLVYCSQCFVTVSSCPMHTVLNLSSINIHWLVYFCTQFHITSSSGPAT